jgi:hypothetical protein
MDQKLGPKELGPYSTRDMVIGSNLNFFISSLLVVLFFFPVCTYVSSTQRFFLLYSIYLASPFKVGSHKGDCTRLRAFVRDEISLVLSSGFTATKWSAK